MRTTYLDTSAIIKRYIEEKGSAEVHKVYGRELVGDIYIAFSAWNIGEAIVVFNKYLNRGYISEKEYETVKRLFISELIRFAKLRLLRLVPVKTEIIISSIPLAEKYKLYIADTIQITSAKRVNSSEFYTADRKLHEAALSENLNSIYLG